MRSERVTRGMTTDRSLGLAPAAFALLLVGCSDAGSAASAPPSVALSTPASTTGTATSVTATAVPTTSGALAIVELRGGLCAPGTCDTIMTPDADGRMHLAAKPPNDLGSATAAQLQALKDAIDSTDFAALRRLRFSGTCPIAHDGQELVFEFTTAHGLERLASCESALDYTAALFKALVGAMGDVAPLGATR